MTDTKTKVREDLLIKRHNLVQTEVDARSKLICKKALGILKEDKKVAVYLAFNNEVDTRYLIDELTKGGKEIYLPTFFSGRETYVFSKFKDWKTLEKGPFNILQPVNTGQIDTELLDMVFIPGVAFDKKGMRLGYGKGIYDRLLANFKGKMVGLAYDFQVVDQIPREGHDLKMDVVVTEKRTMSLRGA